MWSMLLVLDDIICEQSDNQTSVSLTHLQQKDNCALLSDSKLGFSLISNGFLSSLELILVKQIVVLKRGHVLVKLKDERAGRGDVVCQDLLFTHACQVLDDCSERVAMGHHNDFLAGHHLRADLVVPVGQDAVDSDLERLGLGQHIRGQVEISTVKRGMSLVVQFKLGRRNVIGAAPLKHFFFSVLFSSLSFVETL